MTTQELLHNFAINVQEGLSDDQIGVQAEQLEKEVESLVRKETIDDILEMKDRTCLWGDEYLEAYTKGHNTAEDNWEGKIKEYAQSKGITL